MKTKFTIILILLTVICNAQIINFPNANFKARLLSAAPNNYIASTQSLYNTGGVTTFTKIEGLKTRESSPRGPFTEKVVPEIFTSVFSGILISCFPILEIPYVCRI